ncbi:hypothetical protein EJ08DRAFT_652408 [Tothia fuscella]|uniref:Large ribosomal subunit protein bL28m n=1 Tax=Tothia fuscella TaxID=1048955 RepID=A0A9P4NKA1_9PEZI|nr:hypothetical protein EJ08DRAFT_652408 [Tothia fuscella]
MAFRSPSIWPSRLQCLAKRAFSTSTTFLAKSAKNKLASIHANIPPYPHGPNLWYKQSNFGLFGATRIRSGNNVSPRTETKTRRKWRPNIQRKRLWSRALSQYVRVKVSTRVLRTIDKCGGLDEYLLGEKRGWKWAEMGVWLAWKSWSTRYKRMMLKTRVRAYHWVKKLMRRYLSLRKNHVYPSRKSGYSMIGSVRYSRRFCSKNPHPQFTTSY